MIHKSYLRMKIAILSIIFSVPLLSYGALIEPAYIPIEKPDQNSAIVKVIAADGSGDYKSFEEADLDYASLTPPVRYHVRQGTYQGVVRWNSSGTEGKEIVFEPHPSNTGPVSIVNDGHSAETLDIKGSYVIFDGNANRGIIVDGSANPPADHYLVRLNDRRKSHITLSRLQLINALGGGSSAKCVVPEMDSVRIFNCILDTSSSVGIYVQNGNNIEIRNNIVRNCGGTGIQANPHSANSSVNDLIISGNLIYNNGAGNHEGNQPSRNFSPVRFRSIRPSYHL